MKANKVKKDRIRFCCFDKKKHVLYTLTISGNVDVQCLFTMD